MLTIPPVHGFKTLPVDALPKIEKFLQGNSIANQNPVSFFIPLAPLDCTLLDRLDKKWALLAGLSKDDEHDELVEHIFHNWEWSFLVQSDMLNIFRSEKEHEKALTRPAKYKEALDTIGCWKSYNKARFRVALLAAENENFLERLGDQPFFNVKFVPSPNDGKYWDILASMFLRAPKEMLFWMNAPQRRKVFNRRDDMLEWIASHYEIWKLARIFDLACRRPSNAHAVAQMFLTTPYSAITTFTLRRAKETNGKIIKYMVDAADSDGSGDMENNEHEDSVNNSVGEHDAQEEGPKDLDTKDSSGSSPDSYPFDVGGLTPPSLCKLMRYGSSLTLMELACRPCVIRKSALRRGI